jgi:hypothetical protein
LLDSELLELIIVKLTAIQVPKAFQNKKLFWWFVIKVYLYIGSLRYAIAITDRQPIIIDPLR